MSARTKSLPIVAVTVGDCAGVGPEIALACASDERVLQRCVPILLGPAQVLARVSEHLDLPLPPMVDGSRNGLRDIGRLAPGEIQPGRFSAATGRVSFEAVEHAISETLAGRYDAIVTGPIQKEAWNAAGVPFIGHTELLAEKTGTSDYCMMLTSDVISCVLCSVHVPLMDVVANLSTKQIARAIRLGGEALRRRLGRAPKIAVLGLNPHAGENGLISHGEESDLICPALKQARSDGWDVVGPLSPDTAFTPAMRGQIDVYVCMYHDQGLIALKTISFEDAVNVTLGLPIVRTSVDHGTAMDIAWQGKADRTSMMRAIEMAVDLSSVDATQT